MKPIGADGDCKASVVDLVFVVDQSQSVTPARWPLVTDFICQVSLGFDVSQTKTHIGLVIFDTRCTMEFDLTKHKNNADICSAVRSIPYDGGNTNIACGLDMAQFMLTSPDVRGDVSKLVLLVTDGIPTVDVQKTVSSAGSLNRHAKLITVGISRFINRKLLEDIAFKPEYFTFIDGFNELERSANDVVDLLCDAAGNPRTTTPNPADDPCYRCTDYDGEGIGFTGDEDETKCHHYWLCTVNTTTGLNVRSVLRVCPPGTVYSEESAPFGIPCVHEWQVDTTQCGNNRDNQNLMISRDSHSILNRKSTDSRSIKYLLNLCISKDNNIHISRRRTLR